MQGRKLKIWVFAKEMGNFFLAEHTPSQGLGIQVIRLDVKIYQLDKSDVTVVCTLQIKIKFVSLIQRTLVMAICFPRFCRDKEIAIIKNPNIEQL